MRSSFRVAPASGATVSTLNQENLKRTITTPQALGISFHQIVGGGVVSLTGVAIAMTGGGVPIAFVIAALAILIVSIPYAMLGASMPVVGGTYTYATKLLHPVAGFVNLWFFIIQMASLSLYGLAAGSYLHNLNPWFDPTAVCIGLISVFYVANLMGASFSARIGLVLAGVMLVAFGLFIVLGLLHVHWATYPPVVPNGTLKLLQAAALLTFATGGGTVVAELGREMKSPGRTIPTAVIGGTIFAAVMYALIALPAAGILPIAKVAGQPLSVVARSFMPTGLWYFFILGGAVVAVIGTMNAQMLWGSKSALAAVDDGWFPKRIGAVNKRFGTPHWLLTLMFVIGILPAATHLDISTIGSVSSLIGQVTFVIVLLASIRMRTKEPERLANSPFALPAWLHWSLTVLGIAVCAYQFYLLSDGVTTAVWIALAVWILLGVVVFAIRYGIARRTMLERLARGGTLTGSNRTIPGVEGAEREVISMDAVGLPKVGFDNGAIPTLDSASATTTDQTEDHR